MEQNCFKKRAKFLKFQLSNFTLSWSNEGRVNSVRPDLTYLKELQQKMKMFGLKRFNQIMCHGYSSNSNPSLMDIERRICLSQK